MEIPDLITATVNHREEVQADQADLFITVKGSSLVTGKAALKKAREVSQLVQELTGLGVAERTFSSRACSPRCLQG